MNQPTKASNEAPSDVLIAALSEDSLLLVQGADTVKFLQGQLTCDLRLLNDQTCITGLCCTPKGRVIADLFITQLDEETVAIRTAADVKPLLAAHLGKYIVFSKAKIIDATSDWQLFGVFGEKCSDWLSTLVDVLPEEENSCSRGDGWVLIKRKTFSGETRFECYIDSTSTDPQNNRLASGFASARQPSEANVMSAWQRLDIQDGIARIQVPTVETFIPQDLNYDLVDYINFKKGCYTGQEVIARMHYLGKPKRRLYRATSERECAIGSRIIKAGSDQGIGDIVNCYPQQNDAASGHELLISLVNKHSDAELLASSVEGEEHDVVVTVVSAFHPQIEEE